MIGACICWFPGGIFVMVLGLFSPIVINQFLNQAKMVLNYQEEKVACQILKITVIERPEKLLIMSPIIVRNL